MRCARQADPFRARLLQQDAADKVVAFEKTFSERGLSIEEAAFIGNDVNDPGPSKLLDLPCVVADAHQDLNPLGRFRTKHKGGDGADRDYAMRRDGSGAGLSLWNLALTAAGLHYNADTDQPRKFSDEHKGDVRTLPAAWTAIPQLFSRLLGSRNGPAERALLKQRVEAFPPAFGPIRGYSSMMGKGSGTRLT